jgi:hypothetical protein
MNHLSERMRHASAAFVPNGDGLKVRAPCPLPPGLAADLRAIRGDLLAVYRERAAIREFDAGFSRPEAERLAAADTSAWLAGHCDGTRTGQKVLPPHERGQTLDSEATKNHLDRAGQNDTGATP